MGVAPKGVAGLQVTQLAPSYSGGRERRLQGRREEEEEWKEGKIARKRSEQATVKQQEGRVCAAKECVCASNLFSDLISRTVVLQRLVTHLALRRTSDMFSCRTLDCP